MYYIRIQIKLLLETEIVSKLIWVLNNFLTMEFYRKLCNKLYWKKLKPNTASYNTRFWMILFSALSAIWLAFYFNPSDPANTRSSAFIIICFLAYLKQTGVSIYTFMLSVLRLILCRINSVLYNVLNSCNPFLWLGEKAYLKSASLII
ncbi:MAG: hypothetical protein N2510_01405 [Ignavibacteria bacterium]|nr:hypothetical protein [Ignavibacteria bacterium]